MANNYEDPKLLHRLIRSVAGLAVASFFTEVRIKGEENVPQRGPIIVYGASVTREEQTY